MSRMPRARERGQQVVATVAIQRVDDRVRARGDRGAAARSASGRARSGATSPSAIGVLQSGDAHHEELVEIRRRRSRANLRRSSSGIAASAASSSTRSLNASQDSSRLRNSSGSVRRVFCAVFMRRPGCLRPTRRPNTSVIMSAARSRGQPLHRQVAGAFDLDQQHAVLAADVDVLHLLQMLGVERVGERAGSRASLFTTHAVVAVERHVRQVRLLAAARGGGSARCWRRSPCRRAKGRRSRDTERMYCECL